MNDVLLICTLVVSSLNFTFALVRTYINWRTLKESREYWRSWKKRRKDVARDVLKELSTADLERELRRRKLNASKKKRKRKKS